jgi:hypothetical protein
VKDTSELLIQSVTLLKRQRLLTEHLITSGKVSLAKFEAAMLANSATVEHVLEVLVYVFALIDNLVRFQKIAASIPQLNHKKGKEPQALSSGMGDLKEVRNQHQHINNHILNDFTGPLLGTVSWISGSRNYIATFPDIGRERSIPSMVYDREESKFVNEFCYVFGEKYYDLQKAIQSMRNFGDHINRIVRIEANGVEMNPDEFFLALSMEFKAELINSATENSQEATANDVPKN